MPSLERRERDLASMRAYIAQEKPLAMARVARLEQMEKEADAFEAQLKISREQDAEARKRCDQYLRSRNVATWLIPF